MKIFLSTLFRGREEATNKFWILLKFQLKNKLGIKRIYDSMKRPLNKSAALGGIAGLLVLLLLILCIYVPYVVLLVLLAKSAEAGVYFSIVLTFTNIAVLAVAMFSSYSLFSSGKERQILIPLPIPGRYIFAVNYITFYLSGLITSAIFIFTSAVVYAACAQCTYPALLILKALIGSLVFPALPAGAAFIIMSAVFALSGVFRHKEIIATVLGIAAIAAIFILRFYILGENETAYEGMFQSVYTQSGRFLFNIYFLKNALALQSAASWLYILYAAASSAAICIIIYLYGSAIYDRLIQKMNSAAGHKALGQEKYHTKSAAHAFCIKELRTLVRCPVYVLNCLICIIFAPIAAVMLAGNTQSGSMSEIINIFYGMSGGTDAMPAMAGLFVCLIIMSINMVPSTSISREGKYYDICLFLPVKVSEQIKGRGSASVILYILCGVLFIFPYGILQKIDFLYIIYELLIACTASVSFTCIGLFIDMTRPKLIWSKETEAVKQNFNGMAGMLASIVLSVISMVPFFIYITGHMNKAAMLVCVAAISAIEAVMCALLLRNRTRRMEAGYGQIV